MLPWNPLPCRLACLLPIEFSQWRGEKRGLNALLLLLPPRPVGCEQRDQALHPRSGQNGREPGWSEDLCLGLAGMESLQLLQGEVALGPCSAAACSGQTPPRAEGSADVALRRLILVLSARNKVAVLVNVPNSCTPKSLLFHDLLPVNNHQN